MQAMSSHNVLSLEQQGLPGMNGLRLAAGSAYVFKYPSCRPSSCCIIACTALLLMWTCLDACCLPPCRSNTAAIHLLRLGEGWQESQTCIYRPAGQAAVAAGAVEVAGGGLTQGAEGGPGLDQAKELIRVLDDMLDLKKAGNE